MSGGEILLVLVAILLLFGSKNLPSIARNIGRSLETFRKASREVTDEIMRADIRNDLEKPSPPVEATPGVRPATQTLGRHDDPVA